MALLMTGELYMTPGAEAAFTATGHNPLHFLSRHVRGDWGDLCPEDQEANRQAIEHGDRILSSYLLLNGEKLWIITEADRSSTTLLLPEEY